MPKSKIRVNPLIYPMPVVLIGANIRSKPNFMPLAWICMAEHEPPMILISSSNSHYTNEGIIENKTFSVNTPSETMIKATDYCGLHSGKNQNKSEIFEIFFGDLKTAPMIMQAPLNLECEVVKILNTNELIDSDKKGHNIFIGKIVNAYADEKYLTNGVPDLAKMKPFTLTQNDNFYWKMGEKAGKAWSIGKNYLNV
ncbi:MAG: flavin reductase family protein [Promethearchaeota archaeon]